MTDSNVPSTAATSLMGTPSGAATPALSELPPDQAEYSLRVSLADLCARAAVLYAQQKNYEEAAEVYARAAEMQAELNGEMHPDNAEILFLYGRALFKVGQEKSDVLGGKAPADGGSGGGEAAETKKPEEATGGQSKEEKEAAAVALEGKKPLFQFAGDEEWDQSDEEDAEAEDGDDNDEDEDDLAVAFEVLDLARVLFEKQLEAKKDAEATGEENGESGEAKGKKKVTETEADAAGYGDEEETKNADGSSSSTPAVGGALRHALERLADTHDLLAEISLENERYPNAIVDSRASLAYKKQFLPEESESIAEAHFKLSLALEFASVTTASGEDGGDESKQPAQVDQDLRDEAARELEAAIASTQLKLQAKEVELATLHAPEDNDATRRQIADVKEILADMEQRLVDLRKPPIDLNAAVNGPAGAGLGSLLGALSSGVRGSGSSGPAGVEEAKKAATDLTGLVRKKAKDSGGPSGSASTPAAATGSPAASETNGKRKAEAVPEADEEESAKKARTEATA